MGVAFFLFDLAKMLRVSVHDETYGLDVSHHGGNDEDLLNNLDANILIKMKEDGVKLDKTSLLAMCIDQNVAPLSMLMKFDKIAGPSGIIDNDSAYEQLVELVGYNYDDSTVQVDVESY